MDLCVNIVFYYFAKRINKNLYKNYTYFEPKVLYK